MHVALRYLCVLSGCAALAATVALAKDSAAKPKQDKYTVKVPGGLAFSEFKGYESWQVVSVSYDERGMAIIVGNPTMIKAYEAGIPFNGKPVPDGARMAKMHYGQKKQ
ncbi:MAG TPA: cytochrome P460 family protein, partial [Burkholderiales bacterium]|nr:cytochrome P460 family protein [Burkholderiales bacterium]